MTPKEGPPTPRECQKYMEHQGPGCADHMGPTGDPCQCGLDEFLKALERHEKRRALAVRRYSVINRELARISAPLDPGIKDAVEFLRGKGINTAGSCDGKHDNREGQPYVFVELREGESEFDVHGSIVAELLGAGYHGFTVQNDYLYQKSPTPWRKHLRITFWGEAKPE